MRTLFGPDVVSGGAASSLDTHLLHAEQGVVVLPNRDILLQGMYARHGADLVLSTPEDGVFVIKGFFVSDPPPALSDGEGTVISGDQAALFAGPLAPGQYAGAAPAAAGVAIGQVRTVTGTVEVERADGTTVTLRVGDQLFQDDIIVTSANGKIGVVLVDGTTLALGENGELVLDELVYDPATKGGKQVLQLVSGAAEFVSGTIAKSGPDNMTFQTPVGTIGIRGTKVFASFDPATGDVTILNRPTGVDGAGNETAGIIVLTLPNGLVVGNITTGNGGWQWNPTAGQQPQQVQLTEADVQNVVAAVEATVNALQQDQGQQPQNAAPAGQGANAAPAGGQGGAPGAPAAGDNAGGGAAGGTGAPAGQPAPDAQGTPVQQTTDTGTQNGPGQTGPATAANTAPSPAPAPATSPAGSPAPAPTPTAQPAPAPPPPPPPPPPLLAQVTLTGGGTVSDQNPNVAEFTITRTLNLSTSVTVTYTAGGGTATAGVDYTAVTGTVTFAPGETSKQIVVPILSSGRSEGAETFSLTLSGASAGTVISGASAQAVIAADPALPTLSIGNIEVSDAVAGNASLTVTRSGAIYAPSTATYTTVAGSAQPGSDFTAATGTVTFAAGQAIATISIPILANTTPLTTANRENVETFTVELSNAVDATITNGTGTVTITADPNLPTVTIGDIEVSDTTAGLATLTLTRTGSLTLPSSVTYSTVSGSAVAGSDFTAATGTVTFAAGVATATISINVLANTTPLTIANREGVENFTVVLTGASNAILGNTTGTVTVGADPVIGLSTFNIEGGSGVEGGAATVTITRGGDVTGQASVNYATQPGSATSADYSATSGTATFAPGETSQTISIGITNDGTTPREIGESFSVALSGANGGTIGNGTATVTIADDPLPVTEDPVTFSIGSVTAAEGTSATVTVTRGGSTNAAVSVNYSTANGSAHAGSDYTAVSGTLTFAAGQSAATFSVPITDDGSPESAESFTVLLSNPVGGTISNSSALVTIPAQTSADAPVVLGHLTGSEYIQFGGDIMSSAGTLNVSSHTVEVWTRLGVYAYGPPISLTTVQGTNTGYFYYNSNGTVTVRLTQGSDAKQFTSSETLDVGDWTHLAYSYDDTTGLIKIYFNGVEDTGVVIDDNDTFSYVGSGSFFVGSGGPSNFTGGMDNVRVWDTVRSGSEIAENLHNTVSSGETGLQIQYTFEGYAPGTAVNSAATGSSMDGVATGTYFSPNGADYTLHFDGSTYVETPITHSSDSFTLQASIRLSPAGNGQFRPIISKPTVQSGGSDTLEFMMYVDTSDRLVLRIGAGDGNFYDYTGDYLTPGTGYDVAATYDASTGDVGVYVNGVLSVFGSASLANFSDDRQHGTEEVLIGAQDVNGTNGYFYGDITNVRIWDTYMPGATVVTSNESTVSLASFGLMAFYPFADGAGTYVTDISGLEQDASIHGSYAWVQDGAPVVQEIPATLNMEEDTLFSVRLISKDPNALSVSYATHASPSHGTLNLTSGGFLTYKPTYNYVGTDSFVFNVSNTNGDITQKTVNINVTAVNDRPSISASATIDPVVVDETDPDGETIDSLFSSSFMDADGTFVGVVVTSNTANDSTQGAWEYSTDSGSSWHAVGTSILTLSNGALFLSKTAQVRFVPVSGYTGNPGGLIIRALDQAYTSGGGTFTSGASRVTLQDALNASWPVIASGISSYIFVSVNAPGASGPVMWTGNTGSWDTAANWDAGVPGINGDAIIDKAGSSITLNNGDGNTINSLAVTNGTFTLDHSGSNETGLDIDEDFTVAATGTVLLHGGATVEIGTNLDIAAGGSVTVGNGSNADTVEVANTLTNHGTLTLTRGTIAAENFDNYGTFATTASSGTVSVNSTFTNHETGQLNVFSTGGNVTTTILGNYGGFNNYGDINISNANASAADVSLQLNNVQLINHAGSTLNFSTGAGGGYRAFTGTIVNYGASSPDPAAVININHDTNYTGQISNGGIINIAAGKTLNASAATIYMDYSGNEGSLTGEGTLYLDDTDSQVNLYTEDGFTLGEDLTLRFGSEDSSNSTYWYADGTTTLDGTVDLNSGQISGGKFILNGTMSTNRTTAGYDSVSLSGEANVGENSLEISSTGTLTVAAGAAGEETSLYISQGVLNDGAIAISSAGGNNYFATSLSYNMNNPSDPYNESWTNNGLVQTDGVGEVFIQSANLVNSATGSLLFGANDTQFYGRLFNTGSFEIVGGTTLTLVDNTAVNFLGSSTLSYSGSGVATVHLYGGTDYTSYMFFEDDVTIGANTALVLGDETLGDYNDYVGGISDSSMSSDKELALEGTIDFQKGAVSMDVVIKSGGHATNLHTGGLGWNVTVEAGGVIEAYNARELAVGSPTYSTTIASGANVIVSSDFADGWQNAIYFYGTTVNSGTITLVNTGAAAAIGEENVIVIGGDFTTTDSRTVTIGNNQRLEMYDDDAIYRNEAGATFSLTSGGVVYIYAGTMELNYDLGDNFTLVTGATFILGNTSGFSDPAVLTGTTGVGSDPTLFVVNGLIDVNYGDLQVEVDIEAGGELRVENGDLEIQEDLDINGGELNISDVASSMASVTANGHINNTGTISLSSTGGDFARLTMATGKVLSNLAAGTIDFEAGNATANLIVGAVENAGDINVYGLAAFNIGNDDFDNLATGEFHVHSGGTASFTSGAADFVNHGLGTVIIDAGGTMIMGGTNITNAALGIFTVNGDLYMGDGAGGSAVGGGDFTNVATGVLSGSGTIHMEGGGFSGLDGGVTVAPGNSPGRLTIDGDLQFGAESELELELAGTERSQYDVLTVTGRYGLAGTLTALSYAGFAAAAGDRFDVVEWGARTGMFDEAIGLDSMTGVALDMDFRDGGLTLTAKTITADGGAGDNTFTGTVLDDVLVGREGDDTLDGGEGGDLLLGGDGNDLLKGGDGSNRLVGGDGDDTADYSAHIAPINVDLSQGTAAHATGADTIISVENIIGTDAADTIVGNARDNVIAGGKGADVLTGGDGNDTFVLYGPGDAGDTITDFTSGQDVIALDAASFGFAPDTQVGSCFTVIGAAFDGQNGGNAALVYSQADHTLYFATDGAAEGYATLATLQPNAVLTANDIRLTEQVA